MNPQLAQSLPLLIAATLAVALLMLVFSRRYSLGAKPFVVVEIATAIWATTYAVSFLTSGLESKTFWNTLSFSGGAIIPGAWLGLSLQLSGKRQWLTSFTLLLLALEPATVISLAWTNDAHSLMWGPPRLDTDGSLILLKQSSEIAFLLHLAYAASVVFIGIFIFTQSFWQSKVLYLRQYICVMIAVVVPAGAYFPFTLGLLPLSTDPTSYAAIIATLSLLWGIMGTGLFDVVPVAREIIVDGMRDGVIVLDLEDRIVDINHSARALFGLQGGQFFGEPATEVLAILPLPATGSPSSGNLGEFGLNLFGEDRFFDLQVEPLSTKSGRSAGRIIVMHETTDRRKAEDRVKESLAEKEVLLREINHRVKNNLQIISSLLNLQSRDIQGDQALHSFQVSQDRIRAMAMVHEKLYQSDDLARIDFGRYVRSLATDLGSSYGLDSRQIDLNIDVEDILLEVDTAIPCGVIVNELVTNALKHAFPGGRSGKIAIRFHKVDGQNMMVFNDDGVGFPKDLEISNPSSLGLTIVNALAGQLDGNIALARNGGSEISVTFPAM